MPSLRKIEGIGESLAKKFAAAGVRTTKGLLKHCCTSKGREQMSEQTGISRNLILRYANQADLFRVKGIGEEYADLLEAAGVDTVPELAQRNPENLLKKMREVNARKRLVRQLPGLAQVQTWVEQASRLPRMISH